MAGAGQPAWGTADGSVRGREPGAACRVAAAIGSFCTTHGLAPDEPASRALFYVLTGQQTQHRAADPDGSLLAAGYQAGTLAILSVDAGLRSGKVCVVRLPGGAVAGRQNIGFYPLKVLHLGGMILVSGETVTGDRPDNPAAPRVLMRLAEGRAEPVLMPGSWGGLHYHPSGFALHGRFPADGSSLLRLCAPGGEVIRDVPLGGLGGSDHGAELVGCDPTDGRMVLSLGPDGLVILDGPGDRVLARGGAGHRMHSAAHFADADLLLAQTSRHLWSYRLAGGQLKARARAKNLALSGPVLIPDLGAVAITGPRGVRLLAAAATLRPAGKQPGITGVRADSLFGSRDGRCLAVTSLGERQVTVVRFLALAALAAAPMADMTAADMVATADLLGEPDTASAVRPFLELLRECLAYRFQTGERRQCGVRDDEIGIHNGSGGRP